MENICAWKSEVYYGGRIQTVSYGFRYKINFSEKDYGRAHSIKELVENIFIEPSEFGKALLEKGCFNLPTSESKMEIDYGTVYFKKPLDEKELSDLAIELTKNPRSVNRRD